MLGNLLKREVVFDEAEKALVESALSQMEKFKEDVTRSLSSQLSTIFLIISLLFQFFCEEVRQDYHQREMDGYQYKHHFGQLTSKVI